MKGQNKNNKNWEDMDDENHPLRKTETFTARQGFFQDPKMLSSKGTTDMLACFQVCGTVKNTICFPCNILTGGSTITINVGEAGIMIKKGIYEKTLKPGFYYYNDCLYNIIKISLKVQTIPLSGSSLITSDGLSVGIGGFISYKIVNPYLAHYAIQNIGAVLNGMSAGILKNIVGGNSFQALMKNKDEVAGRIGKQLNEAMIRGGVEIPFVDITSIIMPPDMREAMSRAAIAKRQAGAKRIAAKAEVESSKLLKKAGDIMNQNKNSVNLKYFETLKDIAAGWNHTVILPDGMVYVTE